MYHEVTKEDKRRRRRHAIIAMVSVFVLIVLCIFGARSFSLSSREQGAAALRSSIMSAAVRCCAIEGSYPLTLRHLEDSYGLKINHRDYIITYEAYASNVAPSVVVVPR